MEAHLAVLSPVQDLVRGLKIYLRGLEWLKAHPRYLALLFVPILFGFVFMALGVALFSAYEDKLMAMVLFAKPEAWYLLIAYYAAKTLAFIAVIIVTLLSSLLLMNVVASPIYEVVSTAVETDVTGIGPPKLTIFQHLRVMLVELKKVALILALSILVLFIPGLNVVSSLIAAFLVGWDFFDYPLARRGWSFRDRLRLVGGEMFAVLGLGLWVIVPFVQIVMLPLAVVGGTLLNIEALQKRQLISPVPEPERKTAR